MSAVVECEHVIIGAGIAGLVLQHLLESKNSVLIDANPCSYKVGESLIPEVYRHSELAKLLPRARQLPSFTPKCGSIFVGADAAVFFPVVDPEAVVAMHVYRPELEQLMMDAWESPVVRERVIDVDFEARVVTTDRARYRFSGQVIDCSGPAMLVATRLGEVRNLLEIHSRWAYHDIVARDDSAFLADLQARGVGLKHYDTRHYRIVEAGSLGTWAPSSSTILTQVRDGVWCWQIPLFDHTVLSFGVVSRHGPVSQEEYDAVVRDHTASCCQLAPRAPSDHPLDRVHVRSGFARRAERAASEDFILIADAYAFSDPVYSVGVGFAVSQAATIAARLNSGPWDAQAAEFFCQRSDHLVDRAFAAFELWYRGATTSDDDAASEVQFACLDGRMFEEEIFKHYSNMLNDADIEADTDPDDTRDPFHPLPGAEPIDRDVTRLLETSELAGWKQGLALRCAGGVRVTWGNDLGDEVIVLIALANDALPRFQRSGAFDLSYLTPLGKPPRRAIGPLFDELSGRLVTHESDWRVFLRPDDSVRFGAQRR